MPACQRSSGFIVQSRPVRAPVSPDHTSCSSSDDCSPSSDPWFRVLCATHESDVIPHPGCQAITNAPETDDSRVMHYLARRLVECEATMKALSKEMEHITEVYSALVGLQHPKAQCPSASPSSRGRVPLDSAQSRLPNPISSPDVSRSSTLSSLRGPQSIYSRLETYNLIPLLESLNSNISETASFLSNLFHYNDHLIVVPDRRTLDGIQESLVRATWVVGDWVPNELVSRPIPAQEMLKHRSAYELPPVLPRMVFQMVLVNWAAIVLGWTKNPCPMQHAYAEWHQSVHGMRFQLDTENLGLVSSIMRCIDDIASISGWTLKPRWDRTDTCNPVVALRPFIGSLQDLLSDLDYIQSYCHRCPKIHLVAPGTTFTSSSTLMRDGLVLRRRSMFGVRKTYREKEPRVVGSLSLGLKGPDEQILLPPAVARESAFMEAFSRSVKTEEPKGWIRSGVVGGGSSKAVRE